MTDSNHQSTLSKQQIDAVVALYSNGQYQEAIAQIKVLNEAYPNVPFLFNLIGACYKSLGQLEGSVKMFQTAVTIKPDYAEAHKNLGIVLQELGRLDDSVDSLEKALAINPDYIDAHYNLANILKELGRHDDAVRNYEKLIEIKPDYAEAYNNLGNLYKELDRKDDAIKSFHRAVAVNPNFAHAYNNLGTTLVDLGRHDEAIENYKKAIDLNANFAEAFYNYGVVLKLLKQYDDALDSFNSAALIKPNFFEAFNNIASCLLSIGRLGEAIQFYQKSLTINPDYAVAHHDLGNALSSNGQLNDGLRSIKRSIEINPNYAEAYYSLGGILKTKKKREKALIFFEKAFEIKPDIKYLFGYLLNAKMYVCVWDSLYIHFDDLITSNNLDKELIEPFILLGLVDDPVLQGKTAELHTNGFHPKNSELPITGIYPKHPKIRIGYFSADFNQHPVALLTAELYEVHDRDYFEIHAFSFGEDSNDEMNLRIKAGVDHFHNVESMSHKDTVLLARSLEIDIAVDLSGITAEARTGIFAMSVAPIQLSYIGYLGTMGADYYDYLIADPIMIPKESQKHYVEKIAYLPNFQVNDSKDLPPELTMTRKELGLPETGFVFCCFNNTFKITPSTFDSWARILKNTKDSVLILYANNELSKTNLSKEIVKRGIQSERLIFGKNLERSQYLARYRAADLFLDTHPYNAGTTASDALKMGLPMLTMKGKSYQARMGASIVNSVNLPELITNTQEEYESLAIELATNPEKLKAIKDKLKSNLPTAPLYDTKLFAKNIESAYTQMYERHHKGLEPDHIYVK